jgi:hypothetical protein
MGLDYIFEFRRGAAPQTALRRECQAADTLVPARQKSATGCASRLPPGGFRCGEEMSPHSHIRRPPEANAGGSLGRG